jgi:hypothetical protein
MTERTIIHRFFISSATFIGGKTSDQTTMTDRFSVIFYHSLSVFRKKNPTTGIQRYKLNISNGSLPLLRASLA